MAASAGKLTGYGSAKSSRKYEHDGVGRISASEQRTPAAAATAYRFVYTYYADDAVQTTTYPSQRAVTNCYDGLGRVVWVSGVKTGADCTGAASGDNTAYVSGIQYAPHGGIAQLQLGASQIDRQ